MLLWVWGQWGHGGMEWVSVSMGTLGAQRGRRRWCGYGDIRGTEGQMSLWVWGHWGHGGADITVGMGTLRAWGADVTVGMGT